LYYHKPRRSHLRNNKHRAVDYVLPFLILICVGFIVVLLFNLVRALFTSDDTRAAYLHIVEGSAEMKAWGTEEFFNLSSDVLVMQGDEIRASADAQLIVEFFDGTLMRMDGNSMVEFVSIVNEKKVRSIELSLKDGNVWFNKLYKDTAESTDLVLNASNIRVNSNLASVFEVQNGGTQIVRVFNVFDNEGLLVDILNEDASKVVETENVGVGQEVVFDAQVLDRYWKYQSPTVLSAVSDDFKLSNWYLWNVAEDSSPTQFEKSAGVDNLGLVKVDPELQKEEMVEPEKDVEPEVDVEVEVVDEAKVISAEGALAKPVITSVAGGTQVDENGFYKVTSRVATLTGTVSGATKVVVNGYALQKFTAGSSTWTYYANADYSLMKEGANVYEVYTEDASGKKSEVLTVKVFYTPAPAPVVAPAPIVEEKATDDASTPVPADAPVL